MATPSKRKKASKSSRGSRAAKRGRSAIAETGPVTLEEARAIARVKQPEVAAKAARAAATPPTSPESVGEERENLEKKQREELARRVREYKATMAVMKKRGAARSAEPKRAKKVKDEEGARAAFQPLQVFAEGDSWFDYPFPFFGGGIVPRLEDRLGVPILNLATAGDEVRYMLGVEERKLLTKHLKDGCPAGGPWDVLLFSGGGNDIVDNPMALWVRDFNPNVPPAQLVHKARFDTALALVRAGYEDLIELRDCLSPNTVLVFHAYDFAIPDGRGVCHLGPWLKPTFELRKFPAGTARQAVVNEMLKRFAAMLTSLAAQPKVTFINGQGTLAPQPSSWHNELHPSKAGFNKFADLFRNKLNQLFPNRVA